MSKLLRVLKPSYFKPKLNLNPYTVNQFTTFTKLNFNEARHNKLTTELNTTNLYPNYQHSDPPRTSIKHVIEKYGELIKPGEKMEVEGDIVLTGRVKGIRQTSKTLYFVDLHEESSKIQLIVKSPKDKELLNNISLWDNIEVRGIIGKSKVGELSLFVKEHPVKLLSPCLQKLPDWKGVKEVSVKLRNRTLDLLSDQKSFTTLKTRFEVLQYLRQYLTTREFLEVETPILSAQSGGANATPFSTTSKALNQDLQLRISPELYLKQLICSGFPKVFELGKVFRNEGIDSTHLPEFTSLEFYSIYWNLNDLIKFTEDFLNNFIKKFNNGSNTIELENGAKITFNEKFDQIQVIPTLEEKLGEKLPDLYGPVDAFIDVCKRNNVPIKAPFTINRLIDQMISHYIEPMCQNPTFLIGHPITMSPLAKHLPNKPLESARFELFINGAEFINAYEELNDPMVQKERFLQQLKDKELGDKEAQEIDTNFIESLMYGLPPTGGWGLGVDRLIGLVTHSKSIRDTVAFPMVTQNQQ